MGKNKRQQMCASNFSIETLQDLIMLATIDPNGMPDMVKKMNEQYLAKHTIPISQMKGSDDRWYTRIPDPSKISGYRQIRRATREEVEAEVVAWYMEQEGMIKKSLVDIDITMGDYFLRWIRYKEKNRGLQPETFRRYRNDYKRFFAGSDFAGQLVRTVDYIDVESFLALTTEEMNLKRKAVTSLAGYLREMFRLALRDRLRRDNPFDLVDLHNNVYPLCNRDEKPDAERIISAEEVGRLREVLSERHRTHPMYIPDYGIEICLWTGLRVGEVVALQWDDIDAQVLKITRSERRIPHDGKPDEYVIGDTKNHKERLVPVGSNLAAVFYKLRTLQAEHGINSEYVLADESGRITAPQVSNAMYRRGMEADVQAKSIHAIRRTVSSNLNRSYDRATVSHIMGHTEEVNMLHYDYDTVECEKKAQTLDQMYGVA